MHIKNFIAFSLLLLLVIPLSVCGQNPLEPLGFLTGGTWIGEYDLPNGETIRQERIYEWSLDKQIITGKTISVEGDSRKQTRQVIFTWNSDKEVIEFWDFIDTGGYGKGIVKATGKDSLYMEAEIIGSRHIDWRADFINKDGKEFVSEVQVPQDGKWIDAGTFIFYKE